MPTTDPQTLAIQITGSIARITMHRPEVHNAFDATLIRELTETLSAMGHNKSIRAIVLTGSGSTFSAGADLNWMRGMAAATEAENFEDSLHLARLMRTLNFLGKPTIARINGSAYGGGVGLIACCDIAIAAENARFSLSEVKLGLVPAVISPYVIAAIGVRHARRFFLTAEVFDSPEAMRIGLIHQSTASSQLDEAIDRCLHWLGKGGPTAQNEAKKLALRMAGITSEQAEIIDAENARLISRLRVSHEGQTGITAFLAKSAPEWVGS